VVTISALSTVYIKVHVEGAGGGEDVHMALVPPGTTPEQGDWQPAEWDTPTSRGCAARLLVGPAGHNVGAGTWDTWVKVEAGPEIPAFNSGQVNII